MNKTGKNKKVADAGLRVLEVLKRLAKEPLTPEEIIEGLEEHADTRSVYAKETISKYFNTLRLNGFEVEKVNNRFYLKNNIEKINLDLNDVRTFNFLKSFTDNFHKSELNKNLEDVFRIVENCMDKPTRALMEENVGKGIRLRNFAFDKSDKVLKKYESYCIEKRKLKIRYNEKNEIVTYNVEPTDVTFRKNKVFLLAYNRKDMEYKEFLINDIVQVTQSPSKFRGNGNAGTVTYKVKNHLAKVYVMRKEYEYLNDFGDDYKTIVNSGEDKDRLLRRLLRYGENCEVCRPKDFKDKFIEFLDEIINVY